MLFSMLWYRYPIANEQVFMIFHHTDAYTILVFICP